jgi:hypothetical protein
MDKDVEKQSHVQKDVTIGDIDSRKNDIGNSKSNDSADMTAPKNPDADPGLTVPVHDKESQTRVDDIEDRLKKEKAIKEKYGPKETIDSNQPKSSESSNLKESILKDDVKLKKFDPETPAPTPKKEYGGVENIKAPTKSKKPIKESDLDPDGEHLKKAPVTKNLKNLEKSEKIPEGSTKVPLVMPG